MTLAVQFATVPFFLMAWGTARYADWLVLSGVPSLLGLLDLGVASASASNVALAAAKRDDDGVLRSLQTALAFTLAIVLAVVILGGAAAAFVDWRSLLRLETLGSIEASSVLAVLLLHLCTTLLGGPLHAWFIAMDRAAMGTFLLGNRRLVDVAIVVCGLMLGATALQLATALLVGQVITLSSITIYARRASPLAALGLKHACMKEYRSVAAPALAHVGITVGQVITLQGGIQVLNQMAPPVVVVLFSMARTLMRLVMQVGVVVNHAARPVLSNLAGQGRDRDMGLLSDKLTLYGFILAAVCYVFLAGFGPWVTSQWSGGVVAVGHGELAMVGLHALVGVAWYIPASRLMAINQHQRLGASYLLGSCAGLVFAALATPHMGPIVAASIALAIPELGALTLLLLGARVTRGEPPRDSALGTLG